MHVQFRILIALMIMMTGFLSCAARAQTALPPDQDRYLYFLLQSSVDLVSNPYYSEILRQPEFAPAIEPDIEPVQYLVLPETISLRDRIDKLLEGIKVDVPPQYDHYGYEIRRYMAHIFGPGVPGDPARLKQEIKNVRNAKIVLTYWRQTLTKEIDAIRKAIDESKSMDSATRSSFTYNSGLVVAFLLECQSWLDNNENVLKFLNEHQDVYKFKDPFFKFDENKDRLDFIALYKSRLQAHDNIVEYTPFRIMAY